MKGKFFAVAALAAATAFLPGATLAAGDYSPAPASAEADPDVEAGKAAVRAQNWQAAIGAFSKVAATDPRNADAQSYLGFAYRKSGDLDTAFKHYNEALRLDPRHRGAHEYIGEAYLMKGDVAKAKEHLAALDRLCLFGCGEYSDLKKSIAEYEQKKTR
jgi:Flp pilus assembly protein TadD